MSTDRHRRRAVAAVGGDEGVDSGGGGSGGFLAGPHGFGGEEEAGAGYVEFPAAGGDCVVEQELCVADVEGVAVDVVGVEFGAEGPPEAGFPGEVECAGPRGVGGGVA